MQSVLKKYVANCNRQNRRHTDAFGKKRIVYFFNISIFLLTMSSLGTLILIFGYNMSRAHSVHSIIPLILGVNLRIRRSQDVLEPLVELDRWLSGQTALLQLLGQADRALLLLPPR